MAKKTADTNTEWGSSLASTTWSWKKNGGELIGLIVTVALSIGQEYRGKGEKTQTRITLKSADGSLIVAYMPERWAATLAPWTGSMVKIVSSQPGSAETRYDVRPAAGAKPMDRPPQIETTRQEARDPKGDKKRAASNAKRALK